MIKNTGFLDQKHSMPIEEMSSDKGGQIVHPLNATVKCVRQSLSPPSPVKGKIIFNQGRDSHGNNFIHMVTTLLITAFIKVAWEQSENSAGKLMDAQNEIMES